MPMPLTNLLLGPSESGPPEKQLHLTPVLRNSSSQGSGQSLRKIPKAVWSPRNFLPTWIAMSHVGEFCHCRNTPPDSHLELIPFSVSYRKPVGPYQGNSSPYQGEVPAQLVAPGIT